MNVKKDYQWYLETKKTETWCHVEDAFTSEEVDKIIEAGEKEDITEALISKSISLDKSIRNTSISWIPSSDRENEWIVEWFLEWFLLLDILNKIFRQRIDGKMYISTIQFVFKKRIVIVY